MSDGATETIPSVGERGEIEGIVAAIEAVVGDERRPVHLHEPRFEAAERSRVLDCVDSGWVSSAGRYVNELEDRVAAFLGARGAIAIVNGTAALHAALMLTGVVRDDEVLVPALTFVATANAVAHAGAVPHFVEIAASNLGIDVDKLGAHLERVAVKRNGLCINRDTGRTIRTVLPVHVFGHPVDLDPLLELAARWGILVIEDATEALGSRYRGRACGNFGACAVLSFNGNKIVTTGGGGMIVTNDDRLAARIRHVTTTAKLPHAWAFDHDEVGYNYRMPNINAALGCGQMERLDGFLGAKRRLAERYRHAFGSLTSGAFLAEPPGTVSNYWLNTFVLDRRLAPWRDAVLTALHARKLLARPLWTPMHMLPMYRTAPCAAVPVAEDMFQRCISLPSSPFLA